MKILIAGTGAIGSVIGGFLYKSGCDVTLAGRGKHIRHISSYGMTIKGIWGEYSLKNIKTIEPHYLNSHDKFDVMILSVKSYDTLNTITMYAPLLKNDGICVSFQNGLGNMELIASVVGIERTGGARVIFGAEVVEPGIVNVTVYADQIVIGPFNVEHNTNRDKLIKLSEIINQSGIPAYYADDVYPHLWAKMFYNCPLNPLGAMFRMSYGELVKNNEIVLIMNDIVREAFNVAKAKGVSLPWATYQEFLELFYTVLVPSTAGHKASMFQDIEKGKKTEVDALNGAIVKYGRDIGVSTDVNCTIVHIIKAIENEVLNQEMDLQNRERSSLNVLKGGFTPPNK